MRPATCLPCLSLLNSLWLSISALHLWDSFLPIHRNTSDIVALGADHASSSSCLFLILCVSVLKHFKCSWALHAPRSSAGLPTSTCYPQVMLCDLLTGVVLESPSPINSSLKPSPSSQLMLKKSFYSSGQVGSIRPQHTWSLLWFKTPKFWWKHQSQSKVLTSWAHLFVSSFSSLLRGLKTSTICVPKFFSIVSRASEISFDWPQTFCCYIIISSHLKEQERVVAWRLQ